VVQLAQLLNENIPKCKETKLIPKTEKRNRFGGAVYVNYICSKITCFTNIAPIKCKIE
jgi:hypothetical protein